MSRLLIGAAGRFDLVAHFLEQPPDLTAVAADDGVELSLLNGLWASQYPCKSVVDPEQLVPAEVHACTATAEHRARHQALAEAERPLVVDLQAAGIPADSAWDLYKHPEMGEAAFPILLAHLGGDYPDRILEGIARAFTKDVTRRHWQELLDFYLAETRERVRDGLAATLSGAAARTHYADLVEILNNSGLGESRIYFLRPVNRIGNRIEAGSGRKVIEHYEHDPQLGTEAVRILKGRGRND